METSLGIAPELIIDQQTTMYHGVQDKPVLNEVVINPSMFKEHPLESMCANPQKSRAKMGKKLIEELK